MRAAARAGHIVGRLAALNGAVAIMDAEQRRIDRVEEGAGVHACNPSIVMFFSAAMAASPARRHFGIEPLVFQLDTTLGVSSRARATATVPPSVLIMSDAVFIPLVLRKV